MLETASARMPGRVEQLASPCARLSWTWRALVMVRAARTTDAPALPGLLEMTAVFAKLALVAQHAMFRARPAQHLH